MMSIIFVWGDVANWRWEPTLRHDNGRFARATLLWLILYLMEKEAGPLPSYVYCVDAGLSADIH